MSNLANNILEHALHISGNDKAVALELLKIFLLEIKEAEDEIEKLSFHKKYDQLSMLCHKLAGGCSYFGTSDLKNYLLACEKLLSSPPVESKMLEVLIKKTLSCLKKIEKNSDLIFELLQKK